MKKIILTILILLVSFTVAGQEKEKKNLFKLIYDDLLKYGTVYGAGDVRNAIEPPKQHTRV